MRNDNSYTFLHVRRGYHLYINKTTGRFSVDTGDMDSDVIEDMLGVDGVNTFPTLDAIHTVIDKYHAGTRKGTKTPIKRKKAFGPLDLIDRDGKPVKVVGIDRRQRRYIIDKDGTRVRGNNFLRGAYVNNDIVRNTMSTYQDLLAQAEAVMDSISGYRVETPYLGWAARSIEGHDNLVDELVASYQSATAGVNTDV